MENCKKKDKFLPIIPQKNRIHSFKYYLKDNNGESQKVCRRFFTNCFQIAPATLTRFVNSDNSNPSGEERRGRASSKNRTSDEAKETVRAFIKKFPVYESHYGRSSSEKKYLNINLNIATMYRLYLEEMENTNNPLVSEYIFRGIFNTEFNLSFKKRHSDTCNTCNIFAASQNDPSLTEDERRELLESKENHDALREQICRQFKENVNDSSDDTMVLTFDLQKVLCTPFLSDNIAYYKRQLATYNFCIVDEKQQKGKEQINTFKAKLVSFNLL